MTTRSFLAISMVALFLSGTALQADFMDNWTVEQRVSFLQHNANFFLDKTSIEKMYKEYPSQAERAVIDKMTKRLEAAKSLTHKHLQEKFSNRKYKVTRVWGEVYGTCTSEVVVEARKPKGLVEAINKPKALKIQLNSWPYQSDIYVNRAATQSLSRKAYNKAMGFQDFKAPRKCKELLAKKSKASTHANIRTGLISDVAITAGLTIASKVKEGESFSQGCKAAASHMKTAEFLGGDLLCGTLGAALGAAIPLPAIASGAGLLPAFMRRLPVLGSAMIFAKLGSTAISLAKEGELSVGNLLKTANLFQTSGQVLGATLGAAIGSFFPLPGISQIAGALIGGMLAQKLMDSFKTKAVESSKLSKTDFAKAPSIKGETTISSGCSLTAIEAQEVCAYLYQKFIETPAGPAKRRAYEQYSLATRRLNTAISN